MKITFSAGFKNYSTKDRWAYSKLCRSGYADVLSRMTVCTHLTCILLLLVQTESDLGSVFLLLNCVSEKIHQIMYVRRE